MRIPSLRKSLPAAFAVPFILSGCVSQPVKGTGPDAQALVSMEVDRQIARSAEAINRSLARIIEIETKGASAPKRMKWPRPLMKRLRVEDYVGPATDLIRAIAEAAGFRYTLSSVRGDVPFVSMRAHEDTLAGLLSDIDAQTANRLRVTVDVGRRAIVVSVGEDAR